MLYFHHSLALLDSLFLPYLLVTMFLFCEVHMQAFDRDLTTMRSRMEHAWLEAAYSLRSCIDPNYIDRETRSQAGHSTP